MPSVNSDQFYLLHPALGVSKHKFSKTSPHDKRNRKSQCINSVSTASLINLATLKQEVAAESERIQMVSSFTMDTVNVPNSVLLHLD